MRATTHILKNVRVGVRLPAVIGLALVALIVFALSAMSTLETIRIGGTRETELTEQNLYSADLTVPRANLMAAKVIRLDLELAVADGDDDKVDSKKAELEDAMAVFETQTTFWETQLTDTAQRELLTAVADTGNAYIATVRTKLFPAVDARDQAAIDLVTATIQQQFVDHTAAVDAATVQSASTTARMIAEADDLSSSRKSMLWTLLIATLVIVATAAVIVTRSVLKPLGELRSNMEDIASGDGSNADARLDADRKDEFGQVAVAFNTFADKLVATSVEIATTARVAEARAIEVSQAANVAAENMNTVAVATTELTAAASEIARSAGDASRTAENAVRAADHANHLMERLADSSARIGEVVESIRGIAGQTTMLALNATIEAARAGDAGRGFAVVASEVKDLAAETGAATADIVSRVEAIHTDTQAALVALGEVAQVITEISSSQSVIAAAVEEQAATTAEIDRSLTEAVTAVNQLAGQDTTSMHGDRSFTTAA